jgi:hypothetical protein
MHAVCWHEVGHLGVAAVGQLVPQVLVVQHWGWLVRRWD